MPANWDDKFVKCPFYRKNEKNRIVCDGICKGNTINLSFEDCRDKKMYMKEMCDKFDGFPTCPIFTILERMCE